MLYYSCKNNKGAPMKFVGVDILTQPRQDADHWIRCEFCGLEEDVTNVSPLTRLERIEYHRRGSCSKNDLGLDPAWAKKWRGEE